MPPTCFRLVLLGCALKLVPFVLKLRLCGCGCGVWGREEGGGGSMSVFTRWGLVVSCSMNACRHPGACVDGRVWCLVVVVCSCLLLTVVRVVVIVVVGGGVAPKPPRLVWDGVERLQFT